MDSPNVEQIIKKMEANEKEIKVYSDVSEENFLHLYHMSRAGIEKLKGNYLEALDLLGSAAESASTGGFTHMRGLANEVAANILLAKKKHKAAEVYLIEALSAYEQYGAAAKVNMLSEKYPTLQWKKVVAKTTQNSLGTIDFHSVLTASHSLSEEIVLPKLLSKLMNITMENAGAERGYLLLPKPEEKDVLWTAASSVGEEVQIFGAEDNIEKPKVCEGIINYVKRTLQSVVLANASTDKQWRTDPYVATQKVKSVLCVPFARQGTLEAILYLENNLTEGAFNNELLNVLNLLAAQAAISIQNANMYLHMQRAKEQAQHAIQAQRQLSEFLPLVVYSLKLDGQIEYINQRWFTYTGMTLEQSLGNKWTKCLHPEDIEIVASSIVAAAKNVRDLDLECRLKRSDGTYRWHLLRAELRYGDNKEAVGWFGTFLDIDDRKRIEEMNKADQAKSRFLASMSHEMRTPLSGVIGMASLLRITPLSSEQTDMVHTISMCSELLLVLINNILDIFKLEEKQVVLEKLEISPLECAEKSIDIVNVPANDKRIDVVLDFDDDVPQLIIGDSHRLQQIFTNLLGNAVKFTPEGGEIVVKASVDRSPRVDDGNLVHLIFSVQDSGVGVPKEGESKLFQLFSQCDTSTTRVFGGTGLGLAISKRLVEMMNGSIWYENRGKGATFVFTVASPRVAAPAVPLPPEPKISSVYLSGKPNALREVLQSKLQRIGAKVTVTERFEKKLVGEHTCTITVDGEDVDWTQQSFVPGSHVLALSRHLQTSTKTPQGLSFLRKPIKFRRLQQYLSKIVTMEVEQVTAVSASCELLVSDLAIPLRLLLADDNEMNQKVALKLLYSIGHSNVKVANNGVEALQLMEKFQFDVVLMDMEMPIMDGCQATKIIRNTFAGKPIHIISMTANAFPEDWSRCASAGMCTYLPKPVKRDTLSAELTKAALVRAGKHFCAQCSPPDHDKRASR